MRLLSGSLAALIIYFYKNNRTSKALIIYFYKNNRTSNQAAGKT